MVGPVRQVVAVEQRHVGALQRHYLQPVARQLQLLNHLGAQEANEVGGDQILEAWVDFFSDRSPAHGMAALQHQHTLAGFGKIRGVD
jgi:hypothetical protein